jgi:hypothetical protein
VRPVLHVMQTLAEAQATQLGMVHVAQYWFA